MTYAAQESLTGDECRALLTGAHVGHVGISIDALPVVLPVNFIVLGESLMFRTSSSGELYRACVGSVIAFQVDSYDGAGSAGWSVLVRGVATEITDAVEIELAHELWLEAWPLGARADRFLVVPMTLLTGRRFARVG